MTDEEQPRPDFLLVDADEARRYAFQLVKTLGELVWKVRETVDDMPNVGTTDPAFGSVAASLNAAWNDARNDVDKYAARVCAVVAEIYRGVVTLVEVDQEVKADLKRRFGDLG